MPYYLIELNVGISDKLADYIVATYGGASGNIKRFERSGNYTRIIAFASTQTQINNALNDIRTRIAEVQETTYEG